MKNMIESKCLVILILILKLENAFLINDSENNIITQTFTKDNCSEGYHRIELKHGENCIQCPGEEETCLDDCCYPPELDCVNGICTKKENEDIDELQIAAQIGLTLVLLIGILVLLMIVRRACNSVTSDSRRRNRRRWPWRRRSNSSTRNNNDGGDAEFPWPWRRQSNESRISERTLPPSYEDTRFIHLEKPPTYEEALQLALASSLDQTPAATTTQESSLSNHCGDNIRRPQQSGNSQVETISMNIYTHRIETSLGDGRGLRPDFEITSNQDDQDNENNSDSWLDILRFPPSQLHNISSGSLQESSPEQSRNNLTPPRRSRQTRDVATISMNIHTPRIGPPMGDGRGLRSDLEITSNQDDQAAENNPDSWLDILRIPGPRTSIHKYQINNFVNDDACECTTEITDISLTDDDNQDQSPREERRERNVRRTRTGLMEETNISESSSPSNHQNNPMTYSRNNDQRDQNNRTRRVTETSLGIDNEAFDYDI